MTHVLLSVVAQNLLGHFRAPDPFAPLVLVVLQDEDWIGLLHICLLSMSTCSLRLPGFNNAHRPHLGPSVVVGGMTRLLAWLYSFKGQVRDAHSYVHTVNWLSSYLFNYS